MDSKFSDPTIPLADKVAELENESYLINDLIADFGYVSLEAYQSLLEELSISPRVDIFTRYQILGSLFESSVNRVRLESLIAAYIPKSSIIEFKTIEWLFTFETRDSHLPRLYKYLGNTLLEDKVRYSQLKSLSAYPSVVLAGTKFFYQQEISPRYKILAAQYLLQHKIGTDIDDEYHGLIGDMIKIACNPEQEYNVRADAADTVHHYSRNEEIAQEAFKLLRELGGSKSASIYENKQNIHAVDISGLLDVLTKSPPTVSFDAIAERFRKRGDPAVNSSLGRILLDVATYGVKERFTAEQIMERIWSFIQASDAKEEMEGRMFEELQEMADTCSSGHALRLLNVISGYGNDGVRISFDDQIIANFQGRMNARIHAIKDDDLRDAIIADMIFTDQLIQTKSTSDESKMADQSIRARGEKFLIFFSREMPSLVEELRKEFVPEFVTSDRFEESIRQAIDNYNK